jgi:nucleotide-binding universal stress UspA family protein
MPLKNILIYLDNSHHSTARLNLALYLAQRHQARLTALYIITHPYYEPQHIDTVSKTAQMQAEFNSIITEAGVKAELLTVDWKVTGVNVAEIVNLHANYVDLVIIGQTDNTSQDRDTPADLPERVVLGAGRPVLIVPYTASYKDFGNRVLVAWKSGRESARAVNDAIPFLTQAAVVNVLVVNPADPANSDGEKLCAHLACHDISARAEQTTSDNISVGDVLLNRASVEGSDLLVMGAIAHTRLGAPTLGDVAGHILKHMTLPVLMSH